MKAIVDTGYMFCRQEFISRIQSSLKKSIQICDVWTIMLNGKAQIMECIDLYNFNIANIEEHRECEVSISNLLDH